MDGLNFYYLIEFSTLANSAFPGLDLDKDFPGMTQAVAGSAEYNSYQLCTEACIKFLKSKIETLNKDEDKHKVFFEKNQFDDTLPSTGRWEDNEIVKIYIADSKQTVYHSMFTARVFFINSNESASSFFIDGPATLQ